MGDPLRDWVGPFVAVVTPFDSDGNIIEVDFRTLVRGLLVDGARGIIVAGHNGEHWSLRPGEREKLTALAKEEAGDRVPVLCGIEAMAASQVLAEANLVSRAGANGIMLEPPYVVNHATPEELIDRYVRVADKCPVPIMLYNNPWRTHIDMNADVVAKLAQHENIVALKEAVNDFAALTAKIEQTRGHLNIFIGQAALIAPSVLFGAKGFISSGPMEIMRREGASLYELASVGDIQGVYPVHVKAIRVFTALFSMATWPATLKAAMNALGYPAGLPRLPVHPLGRADQANLFKALEAAGIRGLEPSLVAR